MKRYYRPKVDVKTGLNPRGYPLTEDGQLVHRKVYKDAYGKAPRGWVIHHIDFVKTNNDLTNLIALPEMLHNSLHRYMSINSVKLNRVQIEQALKGFKPPRRKGKMLIVVNITA